MSSYSPSTIARIGDLINGIQVDTGLLAGATYLAEAQKELWTVVGRVKVHALFLEVTTVLSNNAALAQFNFTSTTPAIGVQPICAVSASIAQLAVSERILCVGGAVATAAVLTATPGISDINVTPIILGGVSGTGVNNAATIGVLTTTASITSGAVRGSCFYTPMSPGAYVEALV